jgi:ATP-dependent 26S proteasome regulatory subunit
MTIQHLIGAMPGRTTFLVTAEDLAGIKETCEMARALEPSTVVIEDVDLVARSRKDEDANYPALFRLMNEMDGIGQDADVMFILTTNRPDVIEPALAARPGRIDQAILFPLPDDACRERLVRLYANGLSLDEPTIKEMVRRTSGASASFIRELLRKATLFAVERSAPAGTLEHQDLDDALREMVFSGGELGAKLLGGSQRSAGFNMPSAS